MTEEESYTDESLKTIKAWLLQEKQQLDNIEQRIAAVSSAQFVRGNIPGVVLKKTSGVLGVVSYLLSKVLRSSSVLTINGTESTGLAISLTANTNYAFKAYIQLQQAASAGQANFQIHALASGAAIPSAWGLATGINAANTATATATGEVLTATTSILNSLQGNYLSVNAMFWSIIFSGIITVGSNPTTLQIDVIDTLAGEVVGVGSFLEVEQIL